MTEYIVHYISHGQDGEKLDAKTTISDVDNDPKDEFKKITEEVNYWDFEITKIVEENISTK